MKITHRRKSIRASKDIVLDEYQFVGYRDGYGLYRKGSEWVAQDDARKYEPFKITYEQARGFEPIDKHDTGIQKLQKGLGKKLMSSKQIRANTNIDDIEFIMFKYIDSAPGIDVVGHDGNVFDVVCDGLQIRVEFDPDSTARYVYTLDDEGPYAHNSYEFIAGDIYNFVQYARYDEEDEYEEGVEIVESAADVNYEEDIKEIGQEFTSDVSADELADDMDLETGPQEYTSERTSINVNKVPAVFRLVSNWRPDTINLDYGGGRADTAADYLSQYNATNLVYDPYNRTAEHNKEVIKLVREHGGADTATCSNVLNVIKEPEVRRNVLENIKKLVKPSGTVYITVYEGSGKGDEGPTKSGYQLNRKTADYLEEIQEVFPDAKRKGKLIVAHPTGSVNSAINCAADVSMIEEIQNKLEAAVVEFMTSADIGYTEDEVKDYTVVEVEEYESKWSGPSIKCEVRAELSFNAMMDLLDKLNPVVEQYNRNSYFDMEDAGIATAYIPVDSVEGAVTCATTFDDVDVQEFGDGYTETVRLDIDADVLMDGAVEFADDTTFNTLESQHDARFTLAQSDELEELVLETIANELPDDMESGIYHVTGELELEYVVNYDESSLDEDIMLNYVKLKDVSCDYLRPIESATNTCNIGVNPDILDVE